VRDVLEALAGRTAVTIPQVLLLFFGVMAVALIVMTAVRWRD
jgi:hypothetical protein